MAEAFCHRGATLAENGKSGRAGLPRGLRLLAKQAEVDPACPCNLLHSEMFDQAVHRSGASVLRVLAVSPADLLLLHK
jgi:hypothetical protein